VRTAMVREARLWCSPGLAILAGTSFVESNPLILLGEKCWHGPCIEVAVTFHLS